MAGAIITVRRQEGFTLLPNRTLRDNRLSLKTRAILAIMVSLPEDWDYTVAGLAAICDVGKDAVRTSLSELERCGYLTRAQRHNEAGHFSQNEYIVTDTPLSGYPSTDEPSTDEPLTGNPTQQNKDCTNTPYSPPRGDAAGGAAGPVVGQAAAGRRASCWTEGPAQPNDGPPDRDTPAPVQKRAPDWELFERFWLAYPKKKGKEQARRAWRQLNPDLDLCRTMSEALAKDKLSRVWRKNGGEFIPYPATWLRGRRWEDEHEPAAVHETTEPLRGEGVDYA